MQNLFNHSQNINSASSADGGTFQKSFGTPLSLNRLRSLSNTTLISEAKSVAHEERELTARLLHYLREIERRGLHLEMGYGSLHDFCEKELKYSGGAAQRRIEAMRLMKELPQVEEKIKSGELTLSTVLQAQSFFKAEKKLEKTYTKEEKAQLIESLQGKSKREVEKELIKISPLAVTKDKSRQVTEDLVEHRITIKTQTNNNLEKLKNLLSHKNPNMTMSELIHELSEIALDRLDPQRRPPKRNKKVDVAVGRKDLDSKLESNPESESKSESKSEIEYAPSKLQHDATPPAVPPSGVNETSQMDNHESESPSTPGKSKNPHSHTVRVKYEIYKKYDNRCGFVSETGVRCGSRHQLEIDHIIPVAKGGTSDPKNLRLLCRKHNQLMAIRHFGHNKMNQYLKLE